MILRNKLSFIHIILNDKCILCSAVFQIALHKMLEIKNIILMIHIKLH